MIKLNDYLNEKIKDKADFLIDILNNHIKILQKMWSRIESEYPSDYQAFTPKAVALVKTLPLLEDCKVMEIGCNSGLYTCLAARYAHVVYGIDISESLIKRALLTKDYFDNNLYSVHNVKFFTGNFADYIEILDVDALIASLVLYHLGDKNIELLSEFISKKIHKIIIQTRPQRDIAFLKHPEWKTVSVTTKYNGLYRIEDCLNFLRDLGFEHCCVFFMKSSFFYEFFPIIYGEK